MLIGATGQGTRLLNDDPEKPLPVAQMITITNSRHLRIWWAMNSRGDAMDLLFCGYRTSGEAETPTLAGQIFALVTTGWPLLILRLTATGQTQMTTSPSHLLQLQQQPAG